MNTTNETPSAATEGASKNQNETSNNDSISRDATPRQLDLSRIRSLPIARYRQWVPWRREFVNGRWAKYPINPHTGRYARVNDPRSWGTIDQAIAALTTFPNIAGIGFVLTEGDPFVALDIDRCIDPRTGVIHPAAIALARMFDTYVELSPSQVGLRGLGIGINPNQNHKVGSVEVYARSHYVTFTGWHVPGFPEEVTENGYGVHCVVEYLDKHERRGEVAPLREDVPFQSLHIQIPGRADTGPDAYYLGEAKGAKNGPKFSAIYAGCWEPYFESQSEADAFIMDALLYWTNGNIEQSMRLYLDSPLADREKTLRPTRGDMIYAEYTMRNVFQNYVRKQKKLGLYPRTYPLTAPIIKEGELC